MSFLRKLFGREEQEDVPVNLDVDRRKEQLLRLERALDALASEMRADHTTVMHADRKIRTLMAERRSVFNQVTELTNRIKQQATGR